MGTTQKTSCPFCVTSIETCVFAESSSFRAIYNHAPVLPGHALIISKRHVESLLDLNEDDLRELMTFSREATTLLLKVFGAQAFDWTIQDGDAAGQTVPHVHMHILPRMPKDLPSPGDWHPKIMQSETEIIDSARRPKLSEVEMEKIVTQIKKVASEKE